MAVRLLRCARALSDFVLVAVLFGGIGGSQVEAAQIMRIKDNLVRIYAQMTGQTQEQILIDLDRDNFM